MNYQELIQALGLSNKDIIAHLINPVRKGEIYKAGVVIGIKPGKFGGGYSRRGDSFDSRRMRWIKKIKVCVAYDIFTYRKGNHFDWVDVDNCTFEIKEKTETTEKIVLEH